MAHQTNHPHNHNNVGDYFKDHKYQPDIPHEIKSHLSFGQRAADVVTKFCGTWTFIFMLFVFIAVWMGINIVGFMNHWDPWPFIMLNLVLSTISAIQAPIILMSQNREAERDRKRADYDYHINRRAERGIAEIQHDLAHIKYVLQHIYHKKK